MTLAEINALRDLDRPALEVKARLVGLTGFGHHENYPTNDSLRLAIIEKAVEDAVAEQGNGPPPPAEMARSYLNAALEHYADATNRSDLATAQRDIARAPAAFREVEHNERLAADAYRRGKLAVLLSLAAQTIALAGMGEQFSAALGNYFGDESHLDRIAREVRDGLESIRVDGIGVG